MVTTSGAADGVADPEGQELPAATTMRHVQDGSWTVGLRTTDGDEYDVVVGLVDGYARSVRVRHVKRVEVFDSVGAE